jgi:hypothetical protein
MVALGKNEASKRAQIHSSHVLSIALYVQGMEGVLAYIRSSPIDREGYSQVDTTL